VVFNETLSLWIENISLDGIPMLYECKLFFKLEGVIFHLLLDLFTMQLIKFVIRCL